MLRFRSLLPLGLITALAAPLPALADASIGLHIDVPLVHTHTPAHMVTVGPGVWLVEDDATPVYYANGRYWSLHGSLWFRAPHPGGAWVQVGPGYVPMGVRRHVVVHHHAAPVVYQPRTVIHHPGGPVIVHPRHAPPGHVKHVYKHGHKHGQRGHRDRVIVF